MNKIYVIAVLMLVSNTVRDIVANELTLDTNKDTGFHDLGPDNNMGLHDHAPVGVSNNNRINHSVFSFEILENIPSGATIDSATFRFEVLQQGGPQGQSAASFNLHRITRSWDEGSGTSNVGANTMDGATWNNATATELWSTPGGDFDSTVTGSVVVDGGGFYSISSAQLVADIQDIVNGNENNFGFLLKPGMAVPGSSARVKTRESTDGATLTIAFSNAKVLLGDVNRDGEVNLLDVDPFVDRVLSGFCQAEADINQDGAVDLLDVQPFVDVLTGG